MKTESNPEARTPQEIVDELRALVAEAEKIVGGDATRGMCDDTMAALRERLASAQERIAGLYEETKQKVAAGARATDATIRENPYQSLAVALGVGLVVGVLLARSSRE